jgi:membrane protease YdiL (CAAX protease family)
MQTEKTYKKKTAIILSSLSLFMISPILLHWMGWYNPLFDNLGFRVNSLAPWYTWIMGLIIVIAYVIYTFKRIPFVKEKQVEISLFKMTGLFAGISAGLLEEIVFRKWLMNLLMNQGLNSLIQIIISGVIFGLAHSSWIILKKNKRLIVGAVISTIGLGLLLATLYIFSGRNLAPCIVAHMIITAIIEPWLMLAAISDKWGKQTTI